MKIWKRKTEYSRNGKRIKRHKQRYNIKDGDFSKESGLTKKEYDMYSRIAQLARQKGYSIPAINLKKGPLVIDEVNIPDDYATKGLYIPDTTIFSGDDVQSIYIDDNATLKQKVLVFAHELGHVHLDQEDKRNTEPTADKIGADILGVPIGMMKDIPKNADYLIPKVERKKKRRK